MQAPLFIGVDGGGSKTRARLVDAAGRTLGEGAAGAGNARLGDTAFAEVMKACTAAFVSAGLGTADFSRAHAGFGLAGTQQDEDRQSVLDRPHPFASLTVDTDAYAAWLGAFNGADGAILILGTGSAGLAVLKRRRINVGGWGADIGDDGSGMAIGRLAIRRSLWALEGMAPLTPFAEEILARFGSDPRRAVVWAAKAAPGDFAALAPVAFAHAAKGDELAVSVVHQARDEAEMLVRRLVAHGAPQIAMIGGIWPAILPWLSEALRAYLIEPSADSVAGAILMAERALQGIGTDRP